MNWAYIAGFFDGEGCIRFHNTSLMSRGALYCTVVQTKDDGRVLLEEINSFIGRFGVTSRVHTNGNKYNPKHATCYRIDILGWGNSVLFLSYLMPFLRIKKLKAQDMIRYHRVFPYMPIEAICMLRGESRRRNARFRQGNNPTEQASYN